MRNNKAMVKFNSSGLLQSLNGGSSFQRVNPFVGVVKLTYNSRKTYDSEWRFWWGEGNKPSIKCTKTATGTVSLEHNANYVAYVWWDILIINGTNKYGRTVSCINDTKIHSYIYIMNGNSLADLPNVGDVIQLMLMNNTSV